MILVSILILNYIFIFFKKMTFTYFEQIFAFLELLINDSIISYVFNIVITLHFIYRKLLQNLAKIMFLNKIKNESYFLNI